jgi:hypothetical protein
MAIFGNSFNHSVSEEEIFFKIGHIVNLTLKLDEVK